jgi:hypothetical protein
MKQPVATLPHYLALPRESHWRAAKYHLRYLRGTVTLGPRYHGPQSKGSDGIAAGELPVEGCADANLAGCKDTLCSTTGRPFRMNGAAGSRASTLQPTVAQSTVEAEYMAAAAACKEALWHRKLRRDMQLHIEGTTQL